MEDILIKPAKFGKGVFANRNFELGERILNFRGKLWLRDQNPKGLYAPDNHFMQIAWDKYLGPSKTPDNYVNHSCNPNSGVKLFNEKDIALIAIKDIKTGQEITWDYSTTMCNEFWEMKCACGSKNCRGIVSNFSALPVPIQEKYVNLGIAPDYILLTALGVIKQYHTAIKPSKTHKNI